MRELKDLTAISQEIQARLLQNKLSFSEIRYVLSEAQTTFAVMQAAQYVKKSQNQRDHDGVGTNGQATQC
jgi:hypothetical protein